MMFDDRYEVFLADTQQAKSLHYHLRYKVYHVETGWEHSKFVAQNRLERDRYDAYSTHFIVRDRRTDEWVGGVRLVVAPFQHLPLARICRLDDSSGVAFDRQSCVEVSRLFVLPDYRCGRRQLSGEAVADGAGSASHYEILLGLIRAARAYGLNHGLKSWYFLVEPSLARSINRLGIDLLGCGPAINHNGLRRPFYGEVSSCFDRLFSSPSVIRDMFLRDDAYRLYSQSNVLRPQFGRISEGFVESRRVGVCVRI